MSKIKDDGLARSGTGYCTHMVTVGVKGLTDGGLCDAICICCRRRHYSSACDSRTHESVQ